MRTSSAPRNGNAAFTATFTPRREDEPVTIVDAQGATVNGTTPSTRIQRFWFRFALAFQCIMKPKLKAALLAQAELETDGFTSYGFAKRKNPFGMRPALVRPNSQSGAQGGYATYITYWNAVRDRIQWDVYNNIAPPDKQPTVTMGDDTTTPVEAYMEAVQAKGYAEDPEYIQKWMEQYDGEKTDVLGTIISIIIIGVTITLVVWILRRLFGKKKAKRGWKRPRWTTRRTRKG